MLALASLTAIHLLSSPLLRVDFQIQQAVQLPSPALGVPPDTPSTPPGSPPEGVQRPPAQPRYSMAHGFGNEVPLSFATRQIVPPAYRVVFRSDVDQDLRVTWSGGKPWNQALAAALQSHGLRMALSGRILTIGH